MAVSKKLSGTVDGENVEGWVFVKDIQVKTTKNNDPYLRILGLDVTGVMVTINIWPNKGDNEVPDIAIHQVWFVKGSLYKAESGVMMVSARAPECRLVPDGEAKDDFLAVCIPSIPAEDLGRDTAYLQEITGCFASLELIEVSHILWSHMAPYLPTCPAGVKVHEPFRGGLAKHLYEVIQILDNPVFKQWGVNRDILLFSALYHDIGKTLVYDNLLSAKPNAALTSHTFESVRMFLEAAKTCALPENITLQIQHCIVSHHGEYAEIKPATREARTLHHADMMASSLGHLDEVKRTATNIDAHGFVFDGLWKQQVWFPEVLANNN